MEREELYSRSCYKRNFTNSVYDVIAITRIYQPTQCGNWKFLVMDEYFEGVGVYDTLDKVYEEFFDKEIYSSFEEIDFDEYISEVSKETLKQGVWK